MGPLSWLIRTVFVREIRCYKISVMIATAGQTCSIAIGLKDKANAAKFFDEIKCQIVLVDVINPPKLHWQFEVQLTLCDSINDVQLSGNYEPVVFSETFKQSCLIVDPSADPSNFKLERLISKSKDKEVKKIEEVLTKRRSDSEVFSPEKRFFKTRPTPATKLLVAGMSSNLVFRFKFKPQYVKLGQMVVIFDKKLKATGTITRLFE
jgi:GTPase